MHDPVDDRPDEQVAAEAPPKRSGRKGAPPPQEDTLGALAAEPGPGGKKPKAKAKAKPAAAPAKERLTKARPIKERTEPLNFRVAPDFRRAFKRAAAAQDCKKVELLERMFEEWSARNPA